MTVDHYPTGIKKKKYVLMRVWLSKERFNKTALFVLLDGKHENKPIKLFTNQTIEVQKHSV